MFFGFKKWKTKLTLNRQDYLLNAAAPHAPTLTNVWL
jgi:hypothetical protein